MSDLGTQIRTYVEEIGPPFDPETLMNKIDVRADRAPARRIFLAPVFAFVAAFVLVLGVGAVLVSLRGPGSVESAAPATGATQPTSNAPDAESTRPEASSTSMPTSTTASSDGEGSPSAAVVAQKSGDERIVVGGPGFVRLVPRDLQPSVFLGRFQDGELVWVKTATIEGACCMIDIAAAGDRIVVVSEKVDHQEHDPGVWVSDDGYEFTRVPVEQLPFAVGSRGLGFIEAAGPGFVARTFGGTLYVSLDGTEWLSPPEFAEMYPESAVEDEFVLGWGGYARQCSAGGDPWRIRCVRDVP